MKPKKFALKFVLSFAVIAVSVAAYVAFGFFFDVFKEAIPILIVPFIVIPLIASDKVGLKPKGVVAACLICCTLSAAAFAAVGVIAAPIEGTPICCGTEEKFTYSREFMRDNYDIDQRVEIRVWLPDGYSADKKYPVIYALDGDSLFESLAGDASAACAAGKGDVIAVGIGYGYLNPYYARGGVVWQDTAHLRGRWRDFCFADDTEAGYMPGTIFGGAEKRGKEYTDFIAETLVKDIRAKYSTDETNSTIFGHSLGGGLAAYFLTRYDPAKGGENPFTNFVIADNGYLEYYNRKLVDFEHAVNSYGGKTFSPVTVLRIWGGAVNPAGDEEQAAEAAKLAAYGYEGLTSLYYQPEGKNHSDTQTIGTACAVAIALGLMFETTPF